MTTLNIIKKKKGVNNHSVKQAITKVLRYFYFFKYPPNFEEIYTFLEKKCSKRRFTEILQNMQENKIINAKKSAEFAVNFKEKRQNNQTRYTLGEYSNPSLRSVQSGNLFRNYNNKVKFSIRKLRMFRLRLYLQPLSLIPQIRLVGVSGTVSMMNAEKKDDIDLCIISASRRLWTARAICLLLAQMLGLRRLSGDKQAKDKVCLNLFFDGSDLKIPKIKHNGYVGHELLQMKPLINKQHTYERLLAANPWVFKIYPNAKVPNGKDYRMRKIKRRQDSVHFPFSILDSISDLFETGLKKLELISIKKHQTTEIVTHTQLWFFPQDFEKKIPEL